MVVFSSIFRRIHVTLQSNGYYDDDEPMEGWESIPYPTLFDTEDEGEFNKLRTVWKETKKGGFFTVRKEYDKRTGGVGSIKVATFDAFPSEDRVVERRLEERYDALAQHFLERQRPGESAGLLHQGRGPGPRPIDVSSGADPLPSSSGAVGGPGRRGSHLITSVTMGELGSEGTRLAVDHTLRAIKMFGKLGNPVGRRCSTGPWAPSVFPVAASAWTSEGVVLWSKSENGSRPHPPSTVGRITLSEVWRDRKVILAFYIDYNTPV
ncbi:MAG: hypothetical protein J4N84_17135 [Chloroflexi bacterium]|nr:hypothetical protein [Chloroflexota bacterium]